MSRKVSDKTVVSSDINNLFDNIINNNVKLNRTIADVRSETNLFLCKILRFYNVSDLALVQILNTGEKIYCHLTHDILDDGMSIRSMNRGAVKTDAKNRSYIEPYEDIFGIVAKVRWQNNDDENCLISCVNIHKNNNLKNIVGSGEIMITVGNSSISITSDRINILTPSLFVNGLPSTSPQLDNYYDKNETSIITNDMSSRVKELEEKLEKIIEINNLTEEE